MFYSAYMNKAFSSDKRLMKYKYAIYYLQEGTAMSIPIEETA